MTHDTRRRKPLFILFTIVIVAIPLLGLGLFALGMIGPSIQAQMMEYLAVNMSDEERQEYYNRLAVNVPGIWDSISEPRVGRTLQPNTKKIYRQAEITANNAGMRANRSYFGKTKYKFRIACVGDSYVMGTAGKEEDRWGDQVEQILTELGIKVGNRQIEVYSLGIGSWNSVNSATYLTSRMTDYAPDIVLCMMVSNDLDDGYGVKGAGTGTHQFTPEFRHLGSGVFSWIWPQHAFKVEGGRNLLTCGLGSESLARFDRSFIAWKRLEDVLTAQGGRMVFGLMHSDPIYEEQCQRSFEEHGLQSPFIVTDFLGKRLEHDGHPNREGHTILARHYLHVLAELGWLPVSRDALPPLHPDLDLSIAARPDEARLRQLQTEKVAEVLSPSIDFGDMDDNDKRSILGGAFVDEWSPDVIHPIASTKCAFLLQRDSSSATVEMRVRVPARPELFPFTLQMHVGGVAAEELQLESADLAGDYTLRGAIPDDGGSDIAVEVLLRTDCYWANIANPRMSSFYMLSATQVP